MLNAHVFIAQRHHFLMVISYLTPHIMPHKRISNVDKQRLIDARARHEDYVEVVRCGSKVRRKSIYDDRMLLLGRVVELTTSAWTKRWLTHCVDCRGEQRVYNPSDQHGMPNQVPNRCMSVTMPVGSIGV